MIYKLSAFKTFLIITFSLMVPILSYELIGRTLDGFEIRLGRLFLSSIVFSLLFSLVVLRFVMKSYQLEISDNSIIWKDLIGRRISVSRATTKIISVKKFLFFKYLVIGTENGRIFIPLIFVNNKELLEMIEKGSD